MVKIRKIYGSRFGKEKINQNERRTLKTKTLANIDQALE